MNARVKVPTDAARTAEGQLLAWSEDADASKDLMKLFSAIHLLAEEANAATRCAMRRMGEVVGPDDTYEAVEVHREEALKALHNLHYTTEYLSEILSGLATNPVDRAKVAALFLGDVGAEAAE